LNIVMQLRKCCNHPYLFQGAEDRSLDPHGAHLVENCGKLVLLDKLLARLFAKGHRVLIFSQMTRMLDILDDYLVSKGYLYCRIDGKTSYEERSDLIDAFNADHSAKFVFLLSTRAGGLGINLQTADTVVLFDSDWNPQADLQAQDRAHRIGQKRAVHVYRLVTENSIEEKVVERATQKLKLDAMVVQSGRLQENQRKLTKEDMLAAVKFGADAVFRSSDSSICDEDIDTLIERGQKKTATLKQDTKDKGDDYDFSFTFDGNFNTQEFQGVDYSDPKARQQAIDAQLLAMMSEEDLRGAEDKRARKPVSRPHHRRRPPPLLSCNPLQPPPFTPPTIFKTRARLRLFLFPMFM
jgi:SWI/SNF-related matrix-associated actin-dependent regulator of chromatin subfamily A member 5